MSGRIRQRNDGSTTEGSYYKRGFPTLYRSAYLGTAEMTVDTVGNWTQDNLFQAYKTAVRRIRLDGERWDSKGLLRKLDNYPVLNQPDPLDPRQYFPSMDSTRQLMFSNELTAGTNPGVAYVSTPSFIGELGDVMTLLNMAGDVVNWSFGFWKQSAKRLRNYEPLFKLSRANYRLRDLPYLVWCRGMTLLRGIAAGNITWRFGLAPMLGDLQKLLNFVEQTEKRMAMLRQLQATGSIRRRMMLGRTDKPWTVLSTYCCESASTVMYVEKSVRAFQDLWGTARWHLDQDAVLPSTEHEMLDLALRQTYGITRFELLKAMWELTPWSWLCDWFVNVSTFLDSRNNSLPVHLDGACLMRTCYSETKYRQTYLNTSGYSYLNTDVDDAYERYTTKERFPLPWWYAYLPSLPAIPVLTGSQLSILGSLATLRWGRWNLKLFRHGY